MWPTSSTPRALPSIIAGKCCSSELIWLGISRHLDCDSLVRCRLLPQDKVVKALTEYSVYANSEGVFGDRNVMTLAG